MGVLAVRMVLVIEIDAGPFVRTIDEIEAYADAVAAAIEAKDGPETITIEAKRSQIRGVTIERDQ